MWFFRAFLKGFCENIPICQTIGSNIFEQSIGYRLIRMSCSRQIHVCVCLRQCLCVHAHVYAEQMQSHGIKFGWMVNQRFGMYRNVNMHWHANYKLQ